MAQAEGFEWPGGLCYDPQEHLWVGMKADGGGAVGGDGGGDSAAGRCGPGWGGRDGNRRVPGKPAVGPIPQLAACRANRGIRTPRVVAQSIGRLLRIPGEIVEHLGAAEVVERNAPRAGHDRIDVLDS